MYVCMSYARLASSLGNFVDCHSYKVIANYLCVHVSFMQTDDEIAVTIGIVR